MPASTLTSKGQVTIPKPIRDALGVRPGDRVRFVRLDNGTVVVEPETVDVRSLQGMFKHRVKRRISVEEMDEAIAKAVVESLRS
jgi:AbrB family looped-hinge helix DNA binding protein